jgi:hypothetical protein
MSLFGVHFGAIAAGWNKSLAEDVQTLAFHNAAFRRGTKTMRLLILIILIILVVGALPTWPYSSGWGYYPSGGLGTILIILLILALLGIL